MTFSVPSPCSRPLLDFAGSKIAYSLPFPIFVGGKQERHTHTKKTPRKSQKIAGTVPGTAKSDQKVARRAKNSKKKKEREILRGKSAIFLSELRVLLPLIVLPLETPINIKLEHL